MSLVLNALKSFLTLAMIFNFIIAQGGSDDFSDDVVDSNEKVNLTGSVTDSKTGNALAGANIVIEDSDLGAASDENGIYLIEDVPIGSSEKDLLQEGKTPYIPVELTAMQFAFLFHYPQGDFISGELHVPVNQPISMRMESKDVIHAFWVPEFRLKQDVIPGQPTILNFTPTKIGRYPIICAELCGPYHGGMRSTVVVENLEDYQNWFSKNSKEPDLKA